MREKMRFNHDKRRLVAKLLEGQGVAITEIAKELRVPYNRVYHWLRPSRTIEIPDFRGSKFYVDESLQGELDELEERRLHTNGSISGHRLTQRIAGSSG